MTVRNGIARASPLALTVRLGGCPRRLRFRQTTPRRRVPLQSRLGVALVRSSAIPATVWPLIGSPDALS
jgi:hypothetical protein